MEENNATHFTLGNLNESMYKSNNQDHRLASINRVEFQQKPKENPVEINLQNLKSSHFNFGNLNPSN